MLSAVRFAVASLTSAQTTRAPSAANSAAVSAPMPEPAPVMIATLLVSFMSVISRLDRQLGHRSQGGEVLPGDHHRGDAGALPGVQPLPDALARTTQRHFVDQRVGHGTIGLRLEALEVEVLEALGVGLVPVATGDVVVEVQPARAHDAHVEREPWLDLVSTRGGV